VAGLEGRTVFDVETAPDGRLLAATQQGVFVAAAANRGSPVFTPLDAADGSVDIRGRAIAAMGSTAYVGTFGAGLFRLDGDALRNVDFVGAGDSLRDIVCLHVDNTGAMWIGTAGRGAYRCDSAGLTPLDSETLAGRTIYAIAGSESATLWFATNSGLVVRDGAVEARILTDCDVRSVVPMGARSALCATANRGAVLVAWDDRFGWLESRIDEERGLPSDITFAVDVVAGVDGKSFDALIGTSRGLTAYRTSAAAPVVGVAGALANRPLTPAEIESGIVLAYPQRSVVLELFATSTRTFRGQFQYGFDVSDAGGSLVTHGLVRDGKVSLDRLAPGDYRIDVVAFDNDLVASTMRSVHVTVERAPFPWATTGLAALLLFAVLALVWGAVQNRTIARKNAALRAANLELADTRLLVAQETERERSRIARDLHDQTLADLRRLMLLADKLPAPISNVSPRPGELRQRIEEVSGEIRRICEDLSPSALSNLGLGPALEWLVTQAQSEMPADQRFTASVTFSDRLEERIDPGSDLPIQIYRIVQEAVSNVCRHAKATHVEVDARVDDDGALTIRVSDDGVGFDESTEPNGSGRGLGNMRWRADMIHASIEWSRRPGGGTEVTLRRAGVNRSAGSSDEET
jgi:signal transduction histidine kinase